MTDTYWLDLVVIIVMSLAALALTAFDIRNALRGIQDELCKMREGEERPLEITCDKPEDSK